MHPDRQGQHQIGLDGQMCARSTAVAGGGPGLMASQATWYDGHHQVHGDVEDQAQQGQRTRACPRPAPAAAAAAG